MTNLACFGVFWHVLACFGVFRECFGVLQITGQIWGVLACFGMFWRVIGLFWPVALFSSNQHLDLVNILGFAVMVSYGALATNLAT